MEQQRQNMTHSISEARTVSEARSPNDVPLAGLPREARQLTREQALQIGRIKDQGMQLHDVIAACGHSREVSLALTKLEEALIWACKHVTG